MTGVINSLFNLSEDGVIERKDQWPCDSVRSSDECEKERSISREKASLVLTSQYINCLQLQLEEKHAASDQDFSPYPVIHRADIPTII